MVYLELLHGRKTPDEEMNDWGTPGPVFGPVRYVHTTYGCDIKFCLVKPTGEEDESPYLTLGEYGLVYYDGVYYGDWSVFDSRHVCREEYVDRLCEFEQAKAELPAS